MIPRRTRIRRAVRSPKHCTAAWACTGGHLANKAHLANAKTVTPFRRVDAADKIIFVRNVLERPRRSQRDAMQYYVCGVALVTVGTVHLVN